MPPKANAKGRAGADKRRARSDADEALEDSLAEVNDVSAVLSSPAAAAGESAGPPKSAGPPDGSLERRLAKEKTEKEKAMKEKEIMQKRMDEMQAQLELAHAKVGEVVSVESPITPSAGKVRLKLIQTLFV
jgi:hypothetical protein